VLSRYADVLAALREPRLTASGARGGEDLDRAAHLAFRSQASTAVAEIVDALLPRLAPLANQIAAALPPDQPVDLVGQLAKPWSLQIASTLLGPRTDPHRLNAHAIDIFAAAAEPRDPVLQARSEQAVRELAAAFPGPLAAFHVQAYVALSQTLPWFLANAWLALLNHPESAQTLRAEPQLMPQAIEELLRHSGPSRAQFRRAAEAVSLGGATIAQGDRVALLLAAANRDPEPFPNPDALDFRRASPRHLAFGEGRHACLGASLVRAASAAATAVFLERFAGARLEEPVEWCGGFAIVAPAGLRVSRG
jgi:cytochrome P450